jgi:hypothetical protein
MHTHFSQKIRKGEREVCWLNKSEEFLKYLKSCQCDWKEPATFSSENNQIYVRNLIANLR